MCLAATEKVRQSGTIVEGRWFSGQPRYGREKRGLPLLSAKLAQPVRKQQPDPFNRFGGDRGALSAVLDRGALLSNPFQ